MIFPGFFFQPLLLLLLFECASKVHTKGERERERESIAEGGKKKERETGRRGLRNLG